MIPLTSVPSFSKLKEAVHPAVKSLRPQWAIALDAYDGDGGFLDGAYIWRFPRELDGEFLNRRTQARYHNYAATLVDYYTRKVFGDEIQRETSDPALEAWWTNVDGAGTDFSTYMRQALAKALAAGFVPILADKSRDDATGPAVADERAQVFLTRYLPTAVLDWRLDRDEELIAIKLLEDAPSTDILDTDDREPRVLLWDRDEWVRVTETDNDQATIEREPTNLGRVPLVTLRPFRHARWPLIGRPLLGDAGILRALYNRASEQDDVVRNQAFSVFVVTLPATGEVDVEKAKAALGSEIGATRALFTYGGGSYQTPDMAVATTLEAHQSFLIRELYRIAHIPYDRNSADAQSADAIRLQHEELASVLQGVASECQRVEIELCKLFYAWTTATPDLAAAAFEAAKVSITYPDEFFSADPQVELDVLTAAATAVPAPTFEKHVQKIIVSRVAPSLDQATRDTIDQEIDAGEAEKPEPALLDPATLRRGAEARLSGMVPPDGEAAA
jgi:hypothetical protein